MSELQVANFGDVATLSAAGCPSRSNWYAAYTCAQHEKSVARQLQLRSIESFLPLYERVSHWKDRRVKLQLPLFAGYVFVRMALAEKLRVLEIPGVVRLVGFNGHPASLDDQEIEVMRGGLSGGLLAEPHPFLTVGRTVCIRSGPLTGLKGILLRRKGCYRFVISLELIQRSVAVEVDEGDVEPVLGAWMDSNLEPGGELRSGHS
jgi:transcription antitermination factor NusG